MTDDNFNTGDPLGYFITWTAYGTWLPGDENGWQEKGDERQMPNAPSLILKRHGSAIRS